MGIRPLDRGALCERLPVGRDSDARRRPRARLVVSRRGFDREAVQRFVWERSTVRAGEITTQNRNSFLVPSRSPVYGSIGDDTEIHVADRPEDLLVVVAGGPGTHSIYLPTFGDSRATTVMLDE